MEVGDILYQSSNIFFFLSFPYSYCGLGIFFFRFNNPFVFFVLFVFFVFKKDFAGVNLSDEPKFLEFFCFSAIILPCALF